MGHSDMGADQHERRNTNGSLLGVEENVTRRIIQLANVLLNKLGELWKHRTLVALDVRLKAYRALALLSHIFSTTVVHEPYTPHMLVR